MGLAAACLCLQARAANLAAVSGSYGASLGAGAAVAADRSGFGQNPAALSPGRMGFRLDFHRPFGLEDFRVAEAGAFLDGERAGIALDWRATEITDLYAEHGFRLAPSLRLDRAAVPGRLELGYAVEAWRQAEAGEKARWDFAQEMGAVWRPCARLGFGAFAAGWPPFPGQARQARALRFGGEAYSRDPASAGPLQIARLDFHAAEALPWRAAASLTLRPHPALELTAALGVPPFQVSGGLALAWGGARVRQALRYHRWLGRTWLSGLDYARRVPCKEVPSVQPAVGP
jgi:hypothetical protein